MTLIEQIRTLRAIWPDLKGCTGLSCLTLHKRAKPVIHHMCVRTWQMDNQELALYMLTHIGCMAVKDQIDLKVATKLVADQLGQLISLQVNRGDKTENGNPSMAGLEETIRGADGRLSKTPPADPPKSAGN